MESYEKVDGTSISGYKVWISPFITQLQEGSAHEINLMDERYRTHDLGQKVYNKQRGLKEDRGVENNPHTLVRNSRDSIVTRVSRHYRQGLNARPLKGTEEVRTQFALSTTDLCEIPMRASSI